MVLSIVGSFIQIHIGTYLEAHKTQKALQALAHPEKEYLPTLLPSDHPYLQLCNYKDIISSNTIYDYI